MLYHAIQRLEWFFPFFNRRFLMADDLLIWAELLGLEAIPDSVVKKAFTFRTRDKKFFIVYNPHLPPDELVVTLGHEIGHHVLGHTEHAEILFSPANAFCKTGLEKDAGIIGFLAWLPTRELERLLRDSDCYHPESLARELANCDTEWPFLIKACKARLRIWKNFKKIQSRKNLGFSLSTP